MKPSQALETHRTELRQLAARYGVLRPRIFGSVLTGEDTEESDLDLLVDPSASTTLGFKEEAEMVNDIYRTYLRVGSAYRLQEDLARRGIRSKSRMSASGVSSGGCSFSRGALYALLSNPIYIGEIRHRDLRHPGLHEAIVDLDLWAEVQEQLKVLSLERH